MPPASACSLADVGTLEPAGGCEADLTREQVAAEAGVDVDALREAGDRGAAIGAMAGAAAALARRLTTRAGSTVS